MEDTPKTVAQLARERLGHMTPLKDLLAQKPTWWEYEIQLRLRKALDEVANDPEAARQTVDEDTEREFIDYLDRLTHPTE